MSGGKHSRLIVRKGDREISAVCFGYHLISEGFSVGDRVDLVGNIGINEFKGKKTVQLIVRDIDHTEAFWDQVKKVEGDFEEIQRGCLVCASDEVPARDDFAAVYGVLRNGGFFSGKRIYLRKLLAALPDISYLKANIILEVFAECDLCSLQKLGGRHILYQAKRNKREKRSFISPAYENVGIRKIMERNHAGRI